jgi:hypothetical protein
MIPELTAFAGAAWQIEHNWLQIVWDPERELPDIFDFVTYATYRNCRLANWRRPEECEIMNVQIESLPRKVRRRRTL